MASQLKTRRAPPLNVKEAAERCNLTEHQMRRNIESRRLRAVRLWRAVRIHPEHSDVKLVQKKNCDRLFRRRSK